MDFYDSLFQYDLEVQNKLTERLNSFIKSINLLRNESQLNLSNIKNNKYKHINTLIEEINSSNKFKNKLLVNQKKNLLFKMNNKNKINSKYYIYAKDMNKDNQKMDIIEIENGTNREPLMPRVKPQLELSKCFKQNTIEILCDNNNESQNEIGKDHNNISEEEKELEKFKSDVNKIVCDIIKQEVKNKYINKINEIYKNKKNLNMKRLNENNGGSSENSHRQKIKNNNFVRINLPKNEIFLKEEKEGKENKKNNNHSTEKNQNLLNYFNDNDKKTSNKDLRNSVTNNNGKHLKIKVTKNDLLNFNNLNNKNFNNLLIINKKIKSAKENNNIQSNKNFEKENRIKIKETIKIKPKKEDIISSINENEMNSINNKINENNNEDNNEYKIGDVSIKNNKKMIIRNIQRIQIKNIKLKNNPTGYNLTNICQKKLQDFDQNEKDEKNLKKSKLKSRQCASPGDVGLSNRKINILKFKLDRNEATPDRKNTEKLFKQRREVENFNANGKDYDNSIISIIPEKAKDTYSHFIKFSSVRRKPREDSNSHNNDLSQFCNSKKTNINHEQNYKININSKTNLLKNSLTKESDIENYYIADKNNNQIRKSLSKESDSHSYFKRKSDKSNALYINQSNINGKVGESHLNQFHKDNNDKNNCLYNGINLVNNDNNNYNGNINNYIKNEGGMSLDKYKKSKNKNYVNNHIIKQNGNLLKDKYNDTINNRDDLTTQREGMRMKGRRRILSTRVHIRGVNSSKNFNFI